MELDGSKEVCGICQEWKGPRERVDGKVHLKASSKGMCQLNGKIKPAQGGCNFWRKWEVEQGQ